MRVLVINNIDFLRKAIQKILLLLLSGGYFFMFSFQVSAFLGEDLGLELYKNIDTGFYELEQKQYEYEMIGQGETTINQVIGPILAQEGLECDIGSVQDIERLLGDASGNQVAAIISSCTQEGNPIPSILIEKVTNTLSGIRNDFRERAQDKARRSYELARIGLYSDGNIENSPFDLVYDLQEIDKIIFGEELKYEGIPYKNADKALDDFLKEDKAYLYENDENVNNEDSENIEDISILTIDDPFVLNPYIGDNKYMCVLGEGPGLDENTLKDLIDDIEGSGGGYIPKPYSWLYPDTQITNASSWGGPFPAIGPSEEYNSVRDSWKCGKFFCIIVEFQKTNYGLTGGETRSIQKILSKAAEYLEKPANASLTQRKMTTNNFELGSIIKNLPGMLRGFGIEVQSKPVPILDLESEGESILGDEEKELEKQITIYYKNLGLDYNRRNDLDNFQQVGEITKILQTSAGMPTTYIEERNNELNAFREALVENNRALSQSIDNEILYKDMQNFGNQFTELEKFTSTIEDFVKSIKGIIGELEDIPTRSS